ncbi:MAG: lysylphosphatidylglycerol synthase domain-containing protein [Rhodospirillaceae bacterium]
MITAAAAVLGLAAVAGLVVWSGAAEIWGLLHSVGWALLLVPLFHLLPILATTLGWRSLLLAQGWRRPLWRLGWYRWLADSINALLPVAQVGGEVVRGRLMIGGGVPGAAAAAAIIVDLTLGLVTLVVFILLGLALTIGSGSAAPLEGVVAGTALFTLMILGFYRFQRSALPLRLARFMEHQVGGAAWEQLAGGAATLNQELAALYARPGVLARSAGWRLLAWVAGALEMGLAVLLLGQSIGLRQALIFEAVGQAFRNAGFAIPGALGIQEGGLIVAGSLIGLGPDLALTVSLIKRMRDLVLGGPALLIWFQGLAAGRTQGGGTGG